MNERSDPNDRRNYLRRDEDRELREIVESLNFIVFGDARAPGSGLVHHSARMDERITWMIRTNIAAIIAVAGATLGKVFG